MPDIITTVIVTSDMELDKDLSRDYITIGMEKSKSEEEYGTPPRI